MSVPAMNADRRRSPRTNLEGLAYINFEPENGGIVLNVSEEGLCFCAVAPVPAEGAVSFSFFANGKRIDAEGALVWTDRARKTGGLRFTNVPAAAREQINRWIWPSSEAPLVERQPVAPPKRAERLAESIAKPVPVRPRGTVEALSRWSRAPLRWTEFSRGLSVGLLVAIIVALAFTFQAQRGRIGRMLILLGERFESAPSDNASSLARSLPVAAVQPAAGNAAATKTAAAKAASPASRVPVATVSRATPVASGAAVSAPPSSVAGRSFEKPLPPGLAKPAPHSRSANASLATKTPAPAVPSSAAASTPPVSAVATSQPTPPNATSDATAQPAPAAPVDNSNSVTAKAVDSTPDNTEDVTEINSGIPLGRYFTIGKYKDPWAAGQAQRDLANIGFRASLLPKSLLWMKSYEVVVGPYRSAASADDARQNLQSHGYKPRPLAKRSRRLTLVALWANPYSGSEGDTEDFVVSWEAYSADATVKLVTHNGTAASAVGKWVKLPARSEYTSITYVPSANGKRSLLAIQFRGMSQAVSLPGSASHGIVF